MRVLELLEEIEEIVDTAAGFPLTGKIMVDSQELLEIVRRNPCGASGRDPAGTVDKKRKGDGSLQRRRPSTRQ